ncbi:MAG: NADH-quinone oxidoreductase subunit J [Phycisphaeraceae bacterium]|nr:MAG: NADH-quinone oxidoreductase subunit J [Phycisphaeraceae bacterium]
MDHLLSPWLVYSACAVGAAGLCIALPRKTPTPQALGAILAGAAAGLVILALTFTHFEHRPNLYFYIFSIVALGSALRVITHPKPVYAALYFILTIVASAGLYLILSAEFMAFALIIVYAGAILITYLFVIMLASQSPSEAKDDEIPRYDAEAREPVAAAVVGFVLLASLTGLAFRGAAELPATRDAIASLPRHTLSGPREAREARIMSDMPRRVRAILREKGHEVADTDAVAVSVDGRTVTIRPAGGGEARTVGLTEGLSPTNVESLGFNLLRDHPGSIEIAGVILLMAMLGAVVLSRKQVELDEEAKSRQARLLSGDGGEA